MDVWMSMVPCKIFKHHKCHTSAFHSAVPVLEVAVEEVAVEEVAELVVLAVTLVVLVVVWVTVDRVELVIDVIVTVTPDTVTPQNHPSSFMQTQNSKGKQVLCSK